MKIKLILSLIFLIILVSIVYSFVNTEYVRPIDEFYLIIGGTVMSNITLEINATPTGSSGVIDNVTLYHNISGTWGINYTNNSVGTVATETNRIFASTANSIFSEDLSDGLVFIWNAIACDNISQFYNEDVSLSPDVFTIFDNYTNTTGHGFCNSTSVCQHAEIITAGRGQLVNYPVLTLDGTMNTTGIALNSSGGLGCTLNGSVDGFFRCNQTRTNYNGSGLLSTENLITSSVKINYTISSTCRWAGANRTVFVEDAPVINLVSPADDVYAANKTIVFSYNVTGDSDTYSCLLYANDTGTWAVKTGGFTATSNS